jgi:hypothetical protein
MIVKCSHCNIPLSAEDFDSHICDLPLKGVKRISVVYFRDDSYRDKKLMTGWGTDGISYTFEVVPREPIPITIPLSRRKVTDSETADKVTAPFTALYKGAIVFSEH